MYWSGGRLGRPCRHCAGMGYCIYGVYYNSLCFQAFHWCSDGEAAAAEFSRILKPQGVVFFIWNLENRHAPLSSSSQTLRSNLSIGTQQNGLDKSGI